jgi:arsenate reductase (thioredoxin)
MFILGLQGSPRKNGNTDYLISEFIKEIEKNGAKTKLIHVSDKNIKPCTGCRYCEQKGYCNISDDYMSAEIYSLFKKADIVIAATPIFFYSTTAQLKALIDRSQALWARKYKLKLKDPKENFRKGFLLALGATKGKNLFEGIELTAKYFFDAISADFTGSLTFRRLEHPGEIKKVPDIQKNIEKSVKNLLSPLKNRKKIFFLCRENACRSQIASAYAEYFAGDKIEVLSAGSTPAYRINDIMVQVMAEDGIDMAFRKPVSINEALSEVKPDIKPDIIVTMGCGEECPVVPGAKIIDWNLPDPAGKSIEFMRDIRDQIKEKIKLLALIHS